MHWPISGVLAAIAIAIGIALLIVYAVRRGLVHGDLPDTIPSGEVPVEGPARAAGSAQAPRALGAVGATVLVVGLALGVVTALGGWGSGSADPGGCAQSWNGCPQTTAPAATPLPSLPNP